MSRRREGEREEPQKGDFHTQQRKRQNALPYQTLSPTPPRPTYPQIYVKGAPPLSGSKAQNYATEAADRREDLSSLQRVADREVRDHPNI